MSNSQLLLDRRSEIERRYPGATPVLVNASGQQIAAHEAVVLLNAGDTVAYQAWTSGGSYLGGVLVSASDGDLVVVGDSGAIYELREGYIYRRGESRLLGRCSGYGPGTGWYQVAAHVAGTEFDPPSSDGHRGVWSAFIAAVGTIEALRK